MAEKQLTLLPGQYLTIEEAVDTEITIQRSRFIASVRRARDREEFDLRLKEIEAALPKASHHCWAYRFEGAHIIEHATDDGEPSGTAGRPILGAIKKYGLLNTMLVVTRYYGGIKLGVRGLISAYGDTALFALEKAKIVVAEPLLQIRFEMGYEFYNLLLARLEKYALPQEAIKVSFENIISGEITLPNSILASLTADLEQISANQTLFQFRTD